MKKKLSEEHKQKIREAHLKNPVRYWLGKKRFIPRDVRTRQVLARKGDKSYNWKGTGVSYSGIHHWIKRELGKPGKCSNPDCVYPRRNGSRSWLKYPKRFEWANISKRYKRDKEDFISLCPSCHKSWDMGFLKLKIMKNFHG